MTDPYPSLDEHFAAGPPKRILAIDGGAIGGGGTGDGLSLGVLERIETLLKTRHGEDPAFRLCHYFDLIAGTSIGAVVAALLVKGHGVKEVIGMVSQLADQTLFGAAAALAEAPLRTGLMVMERGDAPWPISNTPKGRLRPEGMLGNLLRSATAPVAPGQASPHHNPALQAYWLATLKAHGLQWPAGHNQLLLISLGGGGAQTVSAAAPSGGADGVDLVERLVEGMGHCLTPPRLRDEEGQLLGPHDLVETPCYSYARYVAAQAQVMADHFPPAFDLPNGPLERPLQAPQPLQFTAQLLAERKPFQQRAGNEVIAIRLDLEMGPFTYHKWGATQTCKRGDWLVERHGKVHTVDADTFARTYQQVGPGTYRKRATVWAMPARCDGVIATQEGATQFRKGDYLVWNDREGKDGYAISRDVFESLYEPLPDQT